MNTEHSLLGMNSNTTGITNVSQIAENYYSSVRTRSVIEPDFIYDTFPALNQVPKKLEMDFSRILNKPYFVKNFTYSTTQVQGDTLGQLAIPTDILTNNLAKVPFDASVFYRVKLTLILQISGTPMHQGTLIAAAFPNGYLATPADTALNTILKFNSFMAAPHVFLAANESTSVALEVPFYVNGKLAKVDETLTTISPYTFETNYAQVAVAVLNPLSAPTNGSTSVTVSIHAMFTHMEFYVPHVDITFLPAPPVANTVFAVDDVDEDVPAFSAEGYAADISKVATRAIDGVFAVGKRVASDFLDVARQGIRSLTGLHNHNVPQIVAKHYVQDRQLANNVDQPTQFEKLDPYLDFDRVVSDYVFDSTIDEMNMRNILSKPQLLGTFKVSTADTLGTLCWSRPITPIQQVIDFVYFDANVAANVTTQAFNNLPQIFASLARYWKGTIKIHIQSVMTNFHFCKLAIARDYSPVSASLAQQPDYSSVQNLLVEHIEFSGGNQVQTVELPFCSPLNQLPCTSDFNLNALQHGIYYIYLTQPLVTNGSVPTSVAFNVYISLGEDFQFTGYAVDPLGIRQQSQIPPPPTFKAQASATAVVSDQKAILTENQEKDQQYDLVEHRPIVNIRDISRRFYRVFGLQKKGTEVSAAQGIFPIDLSLILGQRALERVVAGVSVNTANVQRIMSNLFFGYHGGVKVKVMVTGADNATMWYVPPNYKANIIATSPLRIGWTGTVPIPASGAVVPAGTTLYNNNQFALYRDDANFDTRISSNTVFQERCNYRQDSGSLVETANNQYDAASCVFDLEVPYMSPYRFIGDYTKYYTTDPTLALDRSRFNSATSNLGHLILIVPPTKITGSFTNISVDLFVATDDTARYGYQVTTPVLCGLAAPMGAPTYSGRVGTYWDPFGGASLPAIQSSIPTVLKNGSYFTK